MSDVTQILQRLEKGDGKAAEELLPLIYADLRRLAKAKMAAQPPGHTLQPTALVHEAWLRISAETHQWEGRKHFFCSMAQVMRRVLVDHARECQAHKRGGEWRKVPLEAAFPLQAARPDQIVALNEALDRLGRLSPRQAEVVEMRFFVGLTAEETAAMLNVSAETVKLDWKFAKVWLQRQIRAEEKAHGNL